jgi:nucleoside-diphosphate-sugar epimerase
MGGAKAVAAIQEVPLVKIFIAGGTGVIGRPLVARLLAEGHLVVVLVAGMTC